MQNTSRQTQTHTLFSTPTQNLKIIISKSQSLFWRRDFAFAATAAMHAIRLRRMAISLALNTPCHIRFSRVIITSNATYHAREPLPHHAN